LGIAFGHVVERALLIRMKLLIEMLGLMGSFKESNIYQGSFSGKL
jgi:hypothetical protein